MDAYRALHGPDPDCTTWPFLAKIYEVGQPPIDFSKPSVDQLQERDQLLFFPQGAVRDIFRPHNDTHPVREILECPCNKCKRGGSRNQAELEALTPKIEQKSTILLAVLIYIGHGYLIRHFGSSDRIRDGSFDSVTSYLTRDENLAKSKAILHSEDIEAFCKLYDSAVNLFQPPKFSMEGPTTPYETAYRMPFTKDLPHAHGASGKVHKFNIHEDYLDQKIKDADWYSTVNEASSDLSRVYDSLAS